MLIYNIKKEFVGIGEETLRRLGYNTADELLEDVVDFADLFENKPGFIHNFKNFSWIDFIKHSEQDNLKARIRCNGKLYECGFKIETHFFTTHEENDKRGFAIELTDLTTLGNDDASQPRELHEPEALKPLQMPDLLQQETAAPLISTPVTPSKPQPKPEVIIEEEPSIMTEDDLLDFDMDDMLDSQPIPDRTPPVQSIQTPLTQPKPSPKMPQASQEGLDLETPADYAYDPSIAADELGLPADLIDEFVGDFIVQAKKFRQDLEDAVNAQDYDNIQIFSHKLKGVAANLRIEDALEVLTFINSSKDVPKLKVYLDYLYTIIHRLEFGKDALTDDPITSTDETFELSTKEWEDESDPTATPDERLDISSSMDTHDDDAYAFDILSDDDLEPSLTDFNETSSREDFSFAMPDEDFSLVSEDESDFSLENPSSMDSAKFDINKTAAALDIPLETLKSYISDFVDQANTLKSELETALISQNMDAVKELATQLKGMSDALYMNHASQLLLTLQTTTDTQAAIESAKELFIFIREL